MQCWFTNECTCTIRLWEHNKSVGNVHYTNLPCNTFEYIEFEDMKNIHQWQYFHGETNQTFGLHFEHYQIWWTVHIEVMSLQLETLTLNQNMMNSII